MARPRKQNTRKFIPTIYAIVEGEETEASYVKFLKSKLGTDSRIELLHEHPGSARITMFNRAKEILGDSDAETHVWIVCDVDGEAKRIAHLRAQKFKGSDRLNWAVSNPEFAVWLVMHSQGCTSWQDGPHFARLAETLKITNPKNRKKILFESLAGNLKLALANAARSRDFHTRNESEFPDNNPQSDVDLFIRAVVEKHNESAKPGQRAVELEDLY